MEFQEYILVKINGIYEYLTKMDILMFLNNKTKVLYSKYSKKSELELTDKEYAELMKKLEDFIRTDNHYNTDNIETIIEINTNER